MGDFTFEFRQNFNLDEQLIQSIQMCGKITNGDYDQIALEKAQVLKTQIDNVCGAVKKYVPRRIDYDYDLKVDVTCVSHIDASFHSHHDFSAIHNACDLAEKYKDNAPRALSAVKDACRDFTAIISETGQHGNPAELLQQMEVWVERAKTGGEVAISFVQASILALRFSIKNH